MIFVDIFYLNIFIERKHPVKRLLYLLKPPCPKCPYTFGQVKFVANPCPMCKMNDYQTYEMLVKGTYRPSNMPDK